MTRVRAFTTTMVAVLAAVLLASAAAQAAPGDLDASFNGDGIQTTDFGWNDLGSGVALVQPDGKIVVAGRTHGGAGLRHDFALARYNPDGSLDTTFSGDGRQTTDFGDDSFAHGVALQSDGKIVAVGTTNVGLTWDFALARYNDDGSLDASFAGGGTEVTDLGGDTEVAADVAIQSDGQIVVAGRAGDDFGLARYNLDGSLDHSFGLDGIQRTHLGPTGYDSDYAEALALQADGKIVAAGTTDTLPPCDFSIDTCEDPPPDFALVRYNADGTLDSSFSGDGKQITDFGGSEEAFGVALGPGVQQGRIVAVGSGGNGFALAAYNADGTLDSAFSGDGRETTNFGNANDVAADVVLQSDGRIVAVGSGGNGFALSRYNLDGSLDAGFSGDGKQITDFGGSAGASAVALQPDGNLVAVGSAVGAGGADDFALARYQGGSGSSGAPPTNSTTPTISGTATDGQTLTVNPGTWAGSTPIERTYQWRRCDSAGANCVDIAAATAATYTLTGADVGRTIRVRETASNAYGQGAVDSAATAVVNPTVGAIAGRVRSAGTGSPIKGATVKCSNGSLATTASDGSYSMPNVAVGSYSCTATAKRHAPVTQTVTVAPGKTTAANFNLARS